MNNLTTGIRMVRFDGEVLVFADCLGNALDFWIEIHTDGDPKDDVTIWADGSLVATTKCTI
ncbi:MAG: hypothetical protein AAF215_32380 [Cyanobacteria bacterium P01_A01_bin.123]